MPDDAEALATASSPTLQALSEAQFRRRLTIAAATGVAAILLLFVTSTWREQSPALFSLITSTGWALMIAGILGRTWCATYIGGRKKIALVQEGPYSVVRHPLYFFSVMGAAGIGALWGSVLVAIGMAAITATILRQITRKEEAFLQARFGSDYAAYCARVAPFVPRMSLWRGRGEAGINFAVVIRTFVQSCFFLAGVPFAAAVERAHIAEVLPILVRFP